MGTTGRPYRSACAASAPRAAANISRTAGGSPVHGASAAVARTTAAAPGMRGIENEQIKTR